MAGKRICIAAFALGMVSSFSASAAAYPITFYFSGVIDAVNDPEGVLDGIVRTGRSFSGSYTFDSTMADLRPSDPVLGIYGPPGPEVAMVIDTLTITGPSSNTRITVVNETWPKHPWDGYFVDILPFEVSGLQILELGLSLIDDNGVAFDDDSLLLTPPDLACFGVRRLSVQGKASESRSFHIDGTVTRFVPEPTGFLLAFMALSAAIRERRIYHRQNV